MKLDTKNAFLRRVLQAYLRLHQSGNQIFVATEFTMECVNDVLGFAVYVVCYFHGNCRQENVDIGGSSDKVTMLTAPTPSRSVTFVKRLLNRRKKQTTATIK